MANDKAARVKAVPDIEKLRSLGRRLIDSTEVNVLDQVGGRKRKWDRTAIQFERRGTQGDSQMASMQGPEFAWDDSKNEIDVKPGDYIELGGYARPSFSSLRLLNTCTVTWEPIAAPLCSASNIRHASCSSFP